jgi:hypothetical protein
VSWRRHGCADDSGVETTVNKFRRADTGESPPTGEEESGTGDREEGFPNTDPTTAARIAMRRLPCILRGKQESHVKKRAVPQDARKPSTAIYSITREQQGESARFTGRDIGHPAQSILSLWPKTCEPSIARLVFFSARIFLKESSV